MVYAPFKTMVRAIDALLNPVLTFEQYRQALFSAYLTSIDMQGVSSILASAIEKDTTTVIVIPGQSTTPRNGQNRAVTQQLHSMGIQNMVLSETDADNWLMWAAGPGTVDWGSTPTMSQWYKLLLSTYI